MITQVAALNATPLSAKDETVVKSGRVLAEYDPADAWTLAAMPVTPDSPEWDDLYDACGGAQATVWDVLTGVVTPRVAGGLDAQADSSVGVGAHDVALSSLYALLRTGIMGELVGGAVPVSRVARSARARIRHYGLAARRDISVVASREVSIDADPTCADWPALPHAGGASVECDWESIAAAIAMVLRGQGHESPEASAVMVAESLMRLSERGGRASTATRELVREALRVAPELMLPGVC